MKNFFKLISILVCAFSLVMLLTGCNITFLNSGDSSVNCEYISEMQTYITEPSENANVIVDQFTDGACNYYYFKIGEIHCVPIYYSQIQKHNSQTHTLSIRSETSVAKILEKTTNICISETIEKSMMTSIGSSIGTSQDDPINACITGGISYSETASFNSSVGVSFCETLEQSILNSTSEDLYLTSADAKGSYRYIKLATFDVYAVLVCDIDTKTCRYDYITSVQEDSITASWYYAKKEADMSIPNKLDSESKKLAFDVSAVEGMDLYGRIDDVRLLRKWSVYDDQDYSISYFQDTVQYINGNISEIYNSTAPQDCGFKNVKITVDFTLNNPDGWSKYIAKIHSPNNTIYEQSENFSGTNTFTMSKIIDYASFKEMFFTDKSINASFDAEGANWWDLADNHYYLCDCKITVEFLK